MTLPGDKVEETGGGNVREKVPEEVSSLRFLGSELDQKSKRREVNQLTRMDEVSWLMITGDTTETDEDHV